MVKIKTTPTVIDNKVTIADLNQNINTLVKTLSKTNEALTASKSSSSSNSNNKKDKEKAWYIKAGQTAWKNSELNKQSSNIGSTGLGIATGINPAIIQGLGIDKAVGSIIKSTLGGIKKKWAEAGFGVSDNKKVNSAIESNKAKPITSRLDKIFGLLQKRKKETEKTEVQQEKGFFSKLLSFLGSVMGPLLKIAAWGTLLVGISRAINAIADWLGVSPKDVVKTTAPVIGGAGVGLKHVGTNRTKLSDAKIAHREAIRKLLESDYYKKLSPQERAKLFKNNKLNTPKNAPNEFKDILKEVETTRKQIYDTEGYTPKQAKKAETKAAKAGERLAKGGIPTRATQTIKDTTTKFTNRGISKTGKLMTGLAVAGETINTGIDIYNDIKENNKKAIKPDILKGGATLGGLLLGAKGGAVAGGEVAGPWGAVAGGLIGGLGGAYAGEEGVKAIFPDIYKTKTLKDAMQNAPEMIQRPALTEADKAGIYDPALGDGVISHGWDLFWKYVNPGFYIDWARGKPTFFHGHTPKELDPNWMAYVYAQGKMGKPMPTNIPRSAYLDSYSNTTFEEIYEQGLNAYKRRGSLEVTPIDPTQSVSYPDFTTPTHGLATDFTTPIQAADVAESPMIGIEQNTKTTNDYLRDILKALDQNNSTLRGGNMMEFMNNNNRQSSSNSGPSLGQTPPNVREG